MSVVVITPPDPVVSLELAKAHLRVEGDDDDTLIAAYLAAAQAAIDGPAGWLGRAIGVQTLELRLDGFDASAWSYRSGRYAWDVDGWDWACGRWPFQAIRLPCPPLIDVVSITYEDSTGADQVLTSQGWRIDGDGHGVEPTYGTSWPAGRVDANAVRVRYRAGYVANPAADPLVAAPPQPIVVALLLMTADLYANREAATVAPAVARVDNPAADRLLQPFRIWG